jgi:multiple antibiotic resistance protein
MSVFALALSLFLVLNSLGNVPIFVGLLAKYPPKKQRQIIFRELCIALVILLLFNFFGDDLLGMIGISQPVIGLAGGTLLFLIALGMIFPKPEGGHELQRQEPMIVPLAVPLVAGPGGISTVMVYAEQTHKPLLVTAAILIAWIPSLLILLSSSHIKNLLGQKGLLACQKLGGMLIALIAVQMVCSGAIHLVQNTFFVPSLVK